MSSHLHLRKFSFFPGPLHHGFFEDLLMMAIQTLVMWALVVVLICMSLRTGEFVHHFMCSFLFLISGNKLTYWSWFLDSRPGVKIFFFFITYFRTFSDRRYHLQPCSPYEYCVPIGYWFWSCCFGKRLQGGRISSCPTLQFSSVHLLSHVGLWDPMDCSTPGFPVHRQLPELAQIHVHRVDDAIQLSHPLSSPFPPAFNLNIKYMKKNKYKYRINI